MAIKSEMIYRLPKIKICLITNDNVSKKYKQVFDDIVDIPWGDHAKDSEWKIEN